MRILVTGVAGFLASHVADELIAHGHTVIGVDNLMGGSYENINPQCEFHLIDCQDFQALDREIVGEIDLVFHAACTAYDGFATVSPFLISSNTYNASASVFSFAARRGVKKIVYCSSMARYGSQEVIPYTEDLPCYPNNPYAISKYASEMLLRNIAATHGIGYVILVPHNIYGPRQKYDDPYRNVISIMANRILQGKAPVIYGDGTQKRCFSYITDVLPPILRVLETSDADGEVINIGPDDRFISIREMSDLIQVCMGTSFAPIYVPDRPNEIKNAYCSADKARRLLGYEARMSLEEGICETVRSIVAHGAKPFDYKFDIEIPSPLTPITWRDHLI